MEHGTVNDGARFATRARMDIYVDAVNGLDTNDGTQANPLQTRAAAWQRVPIVVAHPVYLHYAAGTYSGINAHATRVLNGIDGTSGTDDGAPIIEYADDTWDPSVYANERTGICAAGTGANVVVDSVGGLPVNGDQPFAIEITSGAAIGQRRTVRNNTATDVVPTGAFSPAPAPGDTYRIFSLAVIFDCESDISGTSFTLGSNVSPALAGPMQTSGGSVALNAHVLVGIDLQHASARNLLLSGQFVFYGCKLGAGSTQVYCFGDVYYGCDQEGYSQLPNVFFGLGNSLIWAGWGLNTTALILGGKSGIGYVVCTTYLDVQRGDYAFFGGFARTVYCGTDAPVAAPCALRLHANATSLRFLIDELGAGATAVVQVYGDRASSVCQLINCQINAAGAVGGVLAHGPGALVRIASGTAGESAAGDSVLARYGAKVVMVGTANYGRAAGNDYNASNGAPQNKSFFAASGDAMVDLANLTSIVRVP